MDPAPPTPAPGFRSHLRAATSASAVPYGYTITIWSSGTVSVDVLGVPHLGKVLLFMAGAVAGFVAVKGAAFGTAGVVTRENAADALALWGFAHWLSAGAAIVLVWAADHVFGDTASWAVAGFLATSVYLVLNAAQTTLAARGRPARATR
jgi:hypothetical protein